MWEEDRSHMSLPQLAALATLWALGGSGSWEGRKKGRKKKGRKEGRDLESLPLGLSWFNLGPSPSSNFFL